MSKVKLQKVKNSIGASVQRIHDEMMKLQGQSEASSLQILSLPKSIGNPHEMNLDFIIGRTGNPETVANVIIEKAKVDFEFAMFLQAVLTKIKERMLEEGIEEKIAASEKRTKEIIEASLKQQKEYQNKIDKALNNEEE